MPQLDFKEIPQANLASGEQDTFELFARDFLHLFGYEILSDPDRGNDLGRDLILLERRTGVGGETQIKWLVSCKHKAHSGQSVGLSDEQDISDRVRSHGCTGFVGFYSTLPASSLNRKLEGIKNDSPGFEFQTFDREKIERILLSTGLGQGLAQRYFPTSYGKWSKSNFDIDLALARIGMPQAVKYRLPNEDRELTLDEVMKLYPQGNQYIFNPWLPGNLILCNNILGITKLLERDGLIDPPIDYFEKMTESMNWNIEAMRRHHVEELRQAESGAAASKAKSRGTTEKKRVSKRQTAKRSRKRNRNK
jgi:hypothetical protein